MKKRNFMIVMAVMIVFAFAFAGCGGGSANEDIAQDLGEGLAEKIAGGDVEFEGTWPEQMPDSVPQFSKGNIESSSALNVGGQRNISVILENVEESSFNEYIEEVKAAGFEEFFASESGGIIMNTYQKDENALTLQFIPKTGEMTIGYTGE